MNIPNLLSHRFLLIIFAASIISFSTVSGSLTDCTEIQVRTEITNTSNGLNNGSFVLQFEGQKDEFEVYLLKGRETKKLKDGKAEGLAKGKYVVVVTGKTQDTKFCPKHIEVKIN